MKNIIVWTFCLSLVLFISKESKAEDIVTIPVGTVAPEQNLEMLDISGMELSVYSVMKDNGVLVIFTCNTCPYVIAWEDRYAELESYCNKNEIGFLLVNSNEAKREGADSYEEMQTHAEDQDYDFFYVVDKNHVLADAYGAAKTPDCFLFDKNFKLAYQGAIDDNMKDKEKVENDYLKDAISNLANGEPIDPNTTKSIGCTIKRIK